MQSILCEPSTNTVLSGASGVSSITLRGIAWSGAGRGICRVECSLDGGKNFTAAELLPQEHLEEVRKPSTAVRESSTNWYWVCRRGVQLPLGTGTHAPLPPPGDTPLYLMSNALLLSHRIGVHSQVKKGEIRGAPPPENGMGRNWAWHQVCTYDTGLYPV